MVGIKALISNGINMNGDLLLLIHVLTSIVI